MVCPYLDHTGNAHNPPSNQRHYLDYTSHPDADPALSSIICEAWPSPRGHFEIIVDNQQLSDTISGLFQLSPGDAHDFQTCHCITELLLDFPTAGYVPGCAHLEPVEWRRRKFNSAADARCNTVLDSGRSHLFVHSDIQYFINNRHNLLIQSDGGCRYVGSSATGWRVIAFDPDGGPAVTIAAGGSLLAGNYFSFSVEARALHEVLTIVSSWITQNK